MKLLQAVAGRSYAAQEAAAQRLVDLCGGLPLAVRVVGVRLSRRGGATAERVAQRLAGEQSRLDELVVGDREVRAVFAMSNARLDPAAATLLRRIGLLPVSEAASWVAAAALGQPVATAERALDRLAEASLVATTDTGRELRYRLHDLVRLYARELADDEDLAALHRIYATAANLVAAADRGLPTHTYPAGAVHPAATVAVDEIVVEPLQWLYAERQLLLAGARDAAERGWTAVAGRLVSGMTNFASLERYTAEWVGDRRIRAGPGGRNRRPCGRGPPARAGAAGTESRRATVGRGSVAPCSPRLRGSSRHRSGRRSQPRT